MDTNILMNDKLTGLQKTYLIARDLKSSHQINESLWYAILEAKDQNIDEINNIDFMDSMCSIKDSAYEIYGNAVRYVCTNIAEDKILQSADKRFLIDKVRTCYNIEATKYIPLVSAILDMSGDEYRNKLKSKSINDYVMMDLGLAELEAARKLLFVKIIRVTNKEHNEGVE